MHQMASTRLITTIFSTLLLFAAISCGSPSEPVIQNSDEAIDSAPDSRTELDVPGEDLQETYDVTNETGDSQEIQDIDEDDGRGYDADDIHIDITREKDECIPSCDEAECGDDGCGGKCGTCTGGKACNQGKCECVPDFLRACCGNAVCSYDSCGMQPQWVVDCPSGCQSARCLDCESHCDGKACGEDGCGILCGRCAAGSCDGLVWTTPAVCVDSLCLGGGAIQNCDDQNPCTVDSCDPQTGCGHGIREDGYVCRQGYCEGSAWTRPATCVAGLCTSGGEIEQCQDDNLCTDDVCDSVMGCFFVANSLPCDDRDKCTTGDKCVGGQCVSTGIQNCDDQNPCTSDTCLKDIGCLHSEVPDGTTCGEGSCSELFFTPPSTCSQGNCVEIDAPVVDCNDGITCTFDSCDPVTECTHDIIDGNCLIEGDCYPNNAMKGICLKCISADSKTAWTTTDVCDDDAECTTDSCNQINGECLHELAQSTCLIDGTCVSDGETGPLPCLFCDSATTTSAWTEAPYGTTCGAGGFCDQGYCCVPDCSGAPCGPDGCGGICETCSPGYMCSGEQCVPFVCGGIKCPDFEGYKVSCNSQQHCEYANLDTSGWKQFDVWIYIDLGSFLMGAPTTESGHLANEEPRHWVTFEKRYLISKYEATVGLYEACNAASPETCSAITNNYPNEWGTNSSANGRSNHPQNSLKWKQAKAVCASVGGRLPTESEWEYAATGPTHQKYPWGTDEPTCADNQAVFDEDFVPGRPWACDPCSTTGCSGTLPVGSKSAGKSWCGAMDMSGNVKEWVLDYYHKTYADAPQDGSPWYEDTTGVGYRVLRSGDYTSVKTDIRTSSRFEGYEGSVSPTYGVRCVRDVDFKCGGIICPVIEGYRTICNEQEHCEYSNSETTGWKDRDVWIYVAPGTFTMGSPTDEYGNSNEYPEHQVTFEKGFLIEKYEVTVSQYDACNNERSTTCTELPIEINDALGWGLNTILNKREDHPQNGLTWDQARAVCSWMQARLPSEAEWEYAAKGPVHRKFPWGSTPEPDCDLAVYDPDGQWTRPWGCQSCTTWGCSGTAESGLTASGASWCGALDMAGNVWEWVEDWRHDSYTGAPTDGSAWVSPTDSRRVVRGGSFNYPSTYLRSSVRGFVTPSNPVAYVGVRCVKPVP